MGSHGQPKSLLALALVFALAACAASEKALLDQGLKPLTAEQVKALFATPRTMDWQGSGRQGTSKIEPDGTVSVQTGPDFHDTGRFRIVEGGWCSTYQRIRQGREACFRVYQTGPNTYRTVTEQGDQDVTFSLR